MRLLAAASLIAAALPVGLSAATATSPPPTGTIEGLVVANYPRVPLAGFCPRLIAQQDGSSLGTVTCTDAKGRYTVTGVSPGDYVVVIPGDGHFLAMYAPNGVSQTKATRFTVTAGQVTKVPGAHLQEAASIRFTGPAGVSMLYQAILTSGGANDFQVDPVAAEPQPDGTYLASGLYAGNYLLTGTDLPQFCQLDSDDSEECPFAYTPWYSGNTAEKQKAKKVKLRFGQRYEIEPKLHQRLELMATITGLPAQTPVVLDGFSAETGAGLWEREGTLNDNHVVRVAHLYGVPYKLRVTAKLGDGSTLTWWVGGAGQRTATVIVGSHVETAAPTKK